MAWRSGLQPLPSGQGAGLSAVTPSTPSSLRPAWGNHHLNNGNRFTVLGGSHHLNNGNRFTVLGGNHHLNNGKCFTVWARGDKRHRKLARASAAYPMVWRGTAGVSADPREGLFPTVPHPGCEASRSGTSPVARSAFFSEHTATLKHTDFLIFNILNFEKWQFHVFVIFAIHFMVYLARL